MVFRGSSSKSFEDAVEIDRDCSFVLPEGDRTAGNEITIDEEYKERYLLVFSLPCGLSNKYFLL